MWDKLQRINNKRDRGFCLSLSHKQRALDHQWSHCSNTMQALSSLSLRCRADSSTLSSTPFWRAIIIISFRDADCLSSGLLTLLSRLVSRESTEFFHSVVNCGPSDLCDVRLSPLTPRDGVGCVRSSGSSWICVARTSSGVMMSLPAMYVPILSLGSHGSSPVFREMTIPMPRF